eukprot:2309617-Amphidinium_carterae.1
MSLICISVMSGKDHLNDSWHGNSSHLGPFWQKQTAYHSKQNSLTATNLWNVILNGKTLKRTRKVETAKETVLTVGSNHTNPTALLRTCASKLPFQHFKQSKKFLEQLARSEKNSATRAVSVGNRICADTLT